MVRAPEVLQIIGGNELEAGGGGGGIAEDVEFLLRYVTTDIERVAGFAGAVTGISNDVRSPVAPQEVPAGVDAALTRLESSYAEPITPPELARIAKPPASRFARIIERVFGISPIQLIAKTRIAAASRLLRETDRSISEIAHECDFYDQSAFKRAFRAVTSVTPTLFGAVKLEPRFSNQKTARIRNRVFSRLR